MNFIPRNINIDQIAKPNSNCNLKKKELQQIASKALELMIEKSEDTKFLLGEMNGNHQDGGLMYYDGHGDLAQRIVGNQTRIPIINQGDDLIFKLRQRINEIVQGKFTNICPECEEFIPLERLLAVPVTRKCVSCKNAKNGNGANGKAIKHSYA